MAASAVLIRACPDRNKVEGRAGLSKMTKGSYNGSENEYLPQRNASNGFLTSRLPPKAALFGVLFFFGVLSVVLQRNSIQSSSLEAGVAIVDFRTVKEQADNNNKNSTFTQYNFKEIVQRYKLATVFKTHFTSSDHAWCTHHYEKNSPTGLLYNKVPKAASSTTSGIALRIAHKVAQRYQDGPVIHPCSSHVDHNPGYNSVGKRYGNRDLEKSFLFGTIRDPAKRAMSRVFFTLVTTGGLEPIDENVLKFLNVTNAQYGCVSPGLGGFQVAYLSMHPLPKYSVWNPDNPTVVSDPGLVHQTVKTILQDYDFMILVERFDESLVVLQLLLGLEPSDLLYLPSKQSGDFTSTDGRCAQSIPPFLSEAVADHLSSKEWYAKSYGDYVLLEATSQSLDLTIEGLGRDKFEAALQKYRVVKRQAQEQCGATAIWPCSKEGDLQKEKAKTNCYSNDLGCGFPCFDALFGSGGK